MNRHPLRPPFDDDDASSQIDDDGCVEQDCTVAESMAVEIRRPRRRRPLLRPLRLLLRYSCLNRATVIVENKYDYDDEDEDEETMRLTKKKKRMFEENEKELTSRLIMEPCRLGRGRSKRECVVTTLLWWQWL